jgi:FMN reductase
MPTSGLPEVAMQQTIHIVGLGGSLGKASTSRSALALALEGAAAGGAKTELIWLRDVELPLYSPEHAPPPAARELADKVHACDAMIWSTPTYHGSLSGALKTLWTG